MPICKVCGTEDNVRCQISLFLDGPNKAMKTHKLCPRCHNTVYNFIKGIPPREHKNLLGQVKQYREAAELIFGRQYDG